MEEEYTFYGEDFYGEKVLLEDARNVYIDQSVLPEGMLDSIKSNQTIEIEGQFYFDNDKLYITPFVIWDEYGENLIEDFEKSKEEDEVLNKDYILPQSASYLLTESDIEGLDIREINYAKNESMRGMAGFSNRLNCRIILIVRNGITVRSVRKNLTIRCFLKLNGKMQIFWLRSSLVWIRKDISWMQSNC